MNDPVVSLLRDLVAINSVNPTLVPGAPGEADIARAIADTMRRAGLDVELQDVSPGRPNVIGILEGRRPGPSLMFCGHTDTVGVVGMDEPFRPIEKDGRLYGRGAQDMKAGVAAMIDAARSIAENGGLASGRLVIAAVVDEEHSSIGADALVTAYRADAAVVTEPTDLAIAIGHKGFAWVEVEVLGKAAHGSRPADGEDAILRLGRVLSQLETLDRTLQSRAPHALVGVGSLHASLITGGRELSSYPDRATLQLERRLTPDEREGDALAEVQQILNALVREDATFRGSARHDVQPAVLRVEQESRASAAGRRGVEKSGRHAGGHRRKLLGRQRSARPRGNSVGAVWTGRSGLALDGGVRERRRGDYLPKRSDRACTRIL